MLSYNNFNSFGIILQLVKFLCCNHNDYIIKEHFLIFGTEVIKKFLGFNKAVLQIFIDYIGGVSRLNCLFLCLQFIRSHRGKLMIYDFQSLVRVNGSNVH